MEINIPLYIGSRWQYRYEPVLVEKYILFDVFTTKEYFINESITIFLSLIERYSIINKISQESGLQESEILDIVNRLNNVWEGLITNEPNTNLYKEIDFDKKCLPYQLSFPKSAEIQITDRCNLKCKHCIVSCEGIAKTECISSEYWIKCIKELDYNRTFKVTITGGEILTYKYIKDVLTFIGNTKMHYYILSNGMLVDDSIAELLNKPNITASISIDGIKSETHDFLRGKNSFKALKLGLETLLKHNVSVDLSVTIHAKNYSEIEDLILYAISIGCHGITFILLDTSGRAEDNVDIHLNNTERKNIINRLFSLKEIYNDKVLINYIDPAIGLSENNMAYDKDSVVHCTGAVSHIAINPIGDIYPCAFAFGMDNFNSSNIKYSSIEEAWGTNKWNIMRGETKYKDLKVCNTCGLNEKCSQQKCRIRAIIDSGDYYGIPKCAKTINM